MIHFYCDPKKNCNFSFPMHLELPSRDDKKVTLTFCLPVRKLFIRLKYDFTS